MRNKKLYKKDRRGIIVSLLIFSFVLMLSVGYSVLNEELTISGEAHFRAQSDIRITDVNLYITSNNGVEDYNSTYGKDSMKAGVTLPSNNSSVTYKVTVTNYSNIPMKINKIAKEIENNNYVVTFNKTLPLTIGKLSSEEIEITFKNNTSSSQTINANLLFTFKKLESVMMSGPGWTSATSDFMRSPIKRNEIKSITFMPNKELPDEAIGSWDASATLGKNEVIGYYLNSDTEGLYDVYIAADGEIYFNEQSWGLFMYLTKMTTINFNNCVNTSKVTNMSYFFMYDEQLDEVDLRNFNTTNTTILSSMFGGCSKLEEIDVSSFNTIKVTKMEGLFNGCKLLKKIVFGKNFDTSKVTTMSGMFQNCNELFDFNISGFVTNTVTDMNAMFKGCWKLNNLNLSNFTTTAVTNMSNMFYDCKSLSSLNINSFRTGEVTDMKAMFWGTALVNLDLSHFDTSKVTSMNTMFRGCSSLEYVNLNSFNTENVTDMSGMFYGCSKINNINVSNFDTKKVTSFLNMFISCSSLTNLDTSNWETPLVTNMHSMFHNCIKLENLNLSKFTILDITDMAYMFYNCAKLKELDIRNMDFNGKTVTTTNMFYNVPSGINIYVLNEYNKTFIEGLNSNANVIIPEA